MIPNQFTRPRAHAAAAVAADILVDPGDCAKIVAGVSTGADGDIRRNALLALAGNWEDLPPDVVQRLLCSFSFLDEPGLSMWWRVLSEAVRDAQTLHHNPSEVHRFGGHGDDPLPIIEVFEEDARVALQRLAPGLGVVQ